MANVPLVDLHAQYDEIKDEMFELWDEILDSMYLYLGPNVQKFEEEFAEHNNVKYCTGVGSGTEAIHYALRAVGVGEGDEVLTPSHTFFATVEAIIHSGAHPVLLDIEPDYYCLSPDSVTNYIENNCEMKGEILRDRMTGKNVKAILPVHIYGQTADMDTFSEIAEEYNLKLISDSCQAHGAEYKGKRAGSTGDIAAFSFYFSKNLGAFGEGGAITTDSDKLSEKVKKLREHGQEDKYHHKSIGYNSRLDELQAAVLRCKLKLLDGWNERRREIASIYNEALEDTPVETPKEAEWAYHVYHLYVIRSKERDELYDYLRENGIGCGMHYPVPCHKQEAMKEYGYDNVSLPETEKTAREILSLPIYPHMTDNQVDTVVHKIKEFYR